MAGNRDVQSMRDVEQDLLRLHEIRLSISILIGHVVDIWIV